MNRRCLQANRNGILTWIGEFRPGNKTIYVVFDPECDFFRSQDLIVESRPSFLYRKAYL